MTDDIELVSELTTIILPYVHNMEKQKSGIKLTKGFSKMQ